MLSKRSQKKPIFYIWYYTVSNVVGQYTFCLFYFKFWTAVVQWLINKNQFNESKMHFNVNLKQKPSEAFAGTYVLQLSQK